MYELDEELEYFLGFSLPEAETTFLKHLRQELEVRKVLSSPPHITVKPPFTYHFEKPLTEQLAKWAKKQKLLPAKFKKIGTFKHPDYVTFFLAPEKARPFRYREQNLSRSIRFLPEENYVPHITLANRIPYNQLDKTKQKLRHLHLTFEFTIDNITLFEHKRFQPWEIKEIFWFGR